jgi:hypothetical protein
MAVIVNGDGILTGISSLATALTDLNTGRGTVTGVATVGTLQLGAGVSMSSPRSQQAAIFTNNTEFFTVDDAGRVGVGTITPNSDAHPENEKKINVGFITARSIAGDIDANTMVVAGVSTFVGALNAGAVSGTTGTFTGDLSIPDKIVHTGDTHTAMRFTGNDTISFDTGGTSRVQITDAATELGNDLKIPDTIVHTGDTNTKIRFPAADTITFETSGSERVRVNSSGNLGIGTNNPAYVLDVVGDGGGSFSASTNSTNGVLSVVGKNSGGSVSAISRIKSYPDGSSNQSHMAFETRNSSNTMVERMRINSSGLVAIGTATARAQFDVIKATGNVIALFEGSNASQNHRVRIDTSGASSTSALSISNSNSNNQTSLYHSGGNNNMVIMGGQTAGAEPTAGTAVATFASGGDVTVNTGNLVIGTSGKGVSFHNYGSGTNVNSNLLDDYEEGSFTWSSNSTSNGWPSDFTIGNQNNSYTKIGNLVTLKGGFTIGNASGTVSQGNYFDMDDSSLPFTVINKGAGSETVQTVGKFFIYQVLGNNVNAAGHVVLVHGGYLRFFVTFTTNPNRVNTGGITYFINYTSSQ